MTRTGPWPPGAVRYGFGVYDQRRDAVRVVGHPGSNRDAWWDADIELVWDCDWTVVVLSHYDVSESLALPGPIIRGDWRQVQEPERSPATDMPPPSTEYAPLRAHAARETVYLMIIVASDLYS